MFHRVTEIKGEERENKPKWQEETQDIPARKYLFPEADGRGDCKPSTAFGRNIKIGSVCLLR